MKTIRSSVLLSAILTCGLAGCAHTPSGVAPRGTVSGFAPCPCDTHPPLPRARRVKEPHRLWTAALTSRKKPPHWSAGM